MCEESNRGENKRGGLLRGNNQREEGRGKDGAATLVEIFS